MPELPEVETTLRAIKPFVINQRITDVIIRYPTLRWPIPSDLGIKLQGKILDVTRRAKYLLFYCTKGTLILHLGMSGKLRLLKEKVTPAKHDHVDICFANHTYLRFTDPRRFGAILWTEVDPHEHTLLAKIGVEPLSKAFNTRYLFTATRKRKGTIKSVLMNSQLVAGIGNIYATEALYLAHVHPDKSAQELTLTECQKLVAACKIILKKAIAKGGTTLKDFLTPNGDPGYFSLKLQVYGREGKPCNRCKRPLQFKRIGQRATVYCRYCQR